MPSEAALPEKFLIYSVSERKCKSEAFRGACLLVQKGGIHMLCWGVYTPQAGELVEVIAPSNALIKTYPHRREQEA